MKAVGTNLERNKLEQAEAHTTARELQIWVRKDAVPACTATGTAFLQRGAGSKSKLVRRRSMDFMDSSIVTGSVIGPREGHVILCNCLGNPHTRRSRYAEVNRDRIGMQERGDGSADGAGMRSHPPVSLLGS